MEALSERYGWTPSQLRAERSEDIRAYLAIFSTKQKLEKRHLDTMKRYGRA